MKLAWQLKMLVGPAGNTLGGVEMVSVAVLGEIDMECGACCGRPLLSAAWLVVGHVEY